MANNKYGGRATSAGASLKELVKAGKFCENIIKNAGEGVIVYDTNFDYVVWNKFMEELTGLPARKVIGQNAFKIFPHLRSQKVDLLLKQALKGQRVFSEDIPFKVPGTDKSGWVRGLYSPYYDDKGRIIGVIGMVRDISDRKAAELALKKSEEKFAKVFQASPESITISTIKEGKIIDVNDGFLKTSGYTRDEVVNHTSRELNIYFDIKERKKSLIILSVRENSKKSLSA